MTTKTIAGGLLLAAVVLANATPALATGDAAAGMKIFNQKCGICHSVEAGKNKIGPSLHGVVGRPSGSIADFNYSDAMKNAHKTWDEATLSAYITNPRAYIPGVKMIFPGLPSETDRANVIAYLAEQK